MLRTIAHIFSILFHPLLMVTYMLLLLLIINPYQFGVNSISGQWKLVLMVFLSTFAMPIFAVFMMKSLNMVKSMQLEDRFERIGPYILTGVFYLWMFINFYNNPMIPKTLVIVMLGSTIALFLAFFFNNFSKISAHAAGMGGLVGMALINSAFFNFDTFTLNFGLLGTYEISTNFVLMTMIVLAGVVCTSRLLLGAHTEKQLYIGFAVGFAAQFIAMLFI
ncbi:MAG: hypothetical protein IPM82_25315 [Saprospiraceae bacterium]|nr:hypothetical protein [Saprospiraceae bacterium]